MMISLKETDMKIKRRQAICCVLVIALLSISGCGKMRLMMGTGGTSGTYYAFGGVLAQYMEQYTDYDKVGARVIGKDTGNWYSNFVIDKGSNDGIKTDMNVMAGTGLVGIVTKVGPNWANVRSIIDDTSNLSGMVMSTSDTLIVSGDLELMDEGYIRFSQLIDEENKVIKGDQVVTSAISNKYLPGISVGYISEIETDANNLTKSGYITPVVDFKKLGTVLVVTELKETMD